ncbi:MAG: dihydrofolate reductase [Oscillibacter sp.]|jgi:dihydrofolate reductase|nr:dihydrofolate reductase [Oscillibacter sp.]
MNAIVLTDQRWAIGLDGGPLFSLEADRKRSGELTEGGTVIVGHRNLGCFPGDQPLPGRRNIIITPNAELKIDGCEIALNPEAALEMAGGPDAENVWILGGGSVYAVLLSRCRRVYRIQVDAKVESPDTWFPNLDKLANWRLDFASEPFQEGKYTYRFTDYVNTDLA